MLKEDKSEEDKENGWLLILVVVLCVVVFKHFRLVTRVFSTFILLFFFVGF